MKLLHNPAELREFLRDFAATKPWEKLEDSLNELVSYYYVHEEAQGAVARGVVSRLVDLRERIRFSLLALSVLHRTDPSPTALKYLQQVIDLYLAGFTTPVFVMAGAVLEAAIRDRIPDELLRAQGVKPAFKAAQDYKLSQRMKLEQTIGILSDDDRQMFWNVTNWRNDAVHVQADVGPDAVLAVLQTAYLLSVLQPYAAGEERSNGG